MRTAYVILAMLICLPIFGGENALNQNNHCEGCCYGTERLVPPEGYDVFYECAQGIWSSPNEQGAMPGAQTCHAYNLPTEEIGFRGWVFTNQNYCFYTTGNVVAPRELESLSVVENSDLARPWMDAASDEMKHYFALTLTPAKLGRVLAEAEMAAAMSEPMERAYTRWSVYRAKFSVITGIELQVGEVPSVTER